MITAKFSIVSVMLLMTLSINTFAQDSKRVYKLDDGTVLTKFQVDSLSKVYQDQLKMKFKMDGDKTIITISLPDNKQQPAEKMNENVVLKNSIPDSISGMKVISSRKVTYVDTLDREISKQEFQEMINELGVSAHYKMEQKNGEQVVVMRPATNRIAAEDIQKFQSQNEKVKSLKGTSFPFEKMTDLVGNVFDPEDLQGKVVAVNYWFVQCAPCIREMPELNQLKKEFEDRDDIVFIAPSLTGSDQIKKMLKERDFTYHLIPDASKHAIRLGITSYPTNMIVDKEGTITFVEIGYHMDTVQKMREEIDKLVD